MSNVRNAGRPCCVISLNFNKVDDTINDVLSLCSNKATRERILYFCNVVQKNLVKPCEVMIEVINFFELHYELHRLVHTFNYQNEICAFEIYLAPASHNIPSLSSVSAIT